MESVAQRSIDGVELDQEQLLELLFIGSRSGRCGIYLHHLEGVDRQQIYQELETERLDRKFQRIREMYTMLRYSWNEIFLVNFFNYLSDMKNRECFTDIAHKLSFSAILRERENLRNLEALFIGCSGLLSIMPQDDFIRDVTKRAEFLLHKYQITPLHPSMWNLQSNMTPPKHPVLRLAQVARLFHDHDMPFNMLIHCRNRDDIIKLFGTEASHEWGRYFGRGENSVCRVGVDRCDLIGINFVVPMLYAYGLFVADDKITDTANDMNESLPPERNKYITEWCRSGLVPKCAYETQALIELKTQYCRTRRCEECHLYRHMLSPRGILPRIPIFYEHL